MALADSRDSIAEAASITDHQFQKMAQKKQKNMPNFWSAFADLLLDFLQDMFAELTWKEPFYWQ